MTIDASIPLRAGQAGLVNLADIYKQAQERQYRDKQMQMQERQMDLQEQQILARMSEQERTAAKEGIKDLAAAVQWAKTPEQWAQVQQHYSQFDPQIATIGFDQRESALLRLGQLSKYLEDTAPKFHTVQAGGAVISTGPRGEDAKYVIEPYQMQGGGGGRKVVRTGKDATGRPVVQYDDGTIEYGDAGSNASGGF